MFDSFIFCSLRSLFNGVYLGTLTGWSTVGPCSRQSSDIYTPSCIGVPSYFLWRLAAEKKQQNLRQFRLMPHSVTPLCCCSLEDLTSS